MWCTTKGFLPPRMTTTQRDAISSPATGLTIYNTTTNALNVYNGSSWVAAGSATPGGSSGQLQYNTGTALGGAAASAYATSGALFTLTAQAATDNPLILKGAASQSGDLLQMQNSSATVVAKVDSSGNVTTPLIHLPGVSTSAGVNGSAGTAAGSSGQVQYNSSGSFAGAAGLSYATSGTIVQATAQAATDKPLVVKGAASQSGSLMEIQNSSGTALVTVDSTGASTRTASETATTFIPSGATAPTNGMYLPAANKIGFATNSTAALTIDSSQNVGIGTVTPGYKLELDAARSADQSLLALTATGDATIGDTTRLIFRGQAAVNHVMYTNASIQAVQTQSGVDSQADLAFSTNASTTLTERMRILANGNVGIGTASPSSILNVGGGTGLVNVRINGASSGSGTGSAVWFDNAGTTNNAVGGYSAIIGGAYDTSLTLYTTSGKVLVPNGNVGIGTTSPSALLHVGGVARVNELIIGETQNTYNGSIEVTYNDLSNYGIFFNDTNTGAQNAPALQFYRNGGGVGNVSLTNSSTAYNTSSDRRLKENIADSAAGLGALMQIPVRDFNFIADPGKTRVQGFIAQELYKIYPKAVTVGGDDAKKKPWAVDYGRVTPLIIKAVQELKSLFDGLVAKVEKLYAMVMGHDAAIKTLQAANDNEALDVKALRADNASLHLQLKAANDNFQHLEQEITALKAVVNRKE